MNNIMLTAEAKATMIANLELELKSRTEKLRAQCETQCASLRSRLERRVNRVPATKRQMPLVELLTPAAPAPAPAPATTRAAPKATTKKAAAVATTTAPVARKTRPVTTNKPAAPTTVTKITATKAATVKTTTKQPVARGKKRGSDEMSSEDKENAALDVPKKRARAPVQKKEAPVSKPAATARTTRAASRQKAAPAQILSPKNNNARQKPAAKSSTRPR